MSDGERALDEEVPDEASGGGQDGALQPRPPAQEGLDEDGEGHDKQGGVEEIAERSD